MSRSSRITIAIAALVAGGCGDGSTNGRPSSVPVPSTPPTIQASARPHVMLILPTTNATDAEILRETIERLAAGGETPFVYREGFTRDGQPPQQQAEVVAESLKRKVQAMIVAPGDPASIGPALAEARDQGIAVVTIGPELAVDGKRLPRIDLSPAEPPARRVVEQLLKDAGASGAAGGSAPAAILLTATGQQWHLQ